MAFKEVKAEELQMNPFTKIGKEWMLITAGNEEKCNTMTASWGGVGIMWGKNAVTTYIRPQRYTKEFVDANDTFTISFFDESYRKALNICGSVSGRKCIMETFFRKTLKMKQLIQNGIHRKIIIPCIFQKS